MEKDLYQKYEELQNKRRLKILSYDKKKYLKLLKEKSVNIDQSEEKSLELLEYSALLEIQIDWETRYQFLELLEEFLKDSISISDFCSQFFERRSLNVDTAAILKSNLVLLTPHEKSVDFLDLLEEIECACERFQTDEENAENEVWNSIEKSFLKIQNYLN